MKNILLALFCTLSIILGINPTASSFSLSAEEWISINGFGTIALTSSDSDLLGFRRTFYTQTPVYKNSVEFRTDSLMGTQLTVQPTDRFKTVFQFIARDFSELNEDSLLQFAYLDFSLHPDLSLRLGRNPLDIFMLSDYKDVGFAYPWARPVTGIYSTLFCHYYEGAEFRYVKETDNGFFNVIGYIGACDAEVTLERYKDISFSSEPLLGLSLLYEHGPFSFTVGYQRGAIEDISQQVTQLSSLWESMEETELFPLAYIQEEISLNGSASDHIILGASYDGGKWLIQSEISQYKFSKALGLTYYSGYLSIGYRIREFTPFVVFSKLYDSCFRFHIDENLIEALPLLEKTAYQMLTNIMDDVDTNQSTLSLGLRWDLTSNCALKFQLDHSRIARAQTTFWKMAPGKIMDQDETVNVYSVSFDFFF